VQDERVQRRPTRRTAVLTVTVGTLLLLIWRAPDVIAHFVVRVRLVLLTVTLSVILAYLASPIREGRTDGAHDADLRLDSGAQEGRPGLVE
jgi:hypothetical protein